MDWGKQTGGMQNGGMRTRECGHGNADMGMQTREYASGVQCTRVQRYKVVKSTRQYNLLLLKERGGTGRVT